MRIFVKFVSVEAATKALVDLQGRFFAGREVSDGAVMAAAGAGGEVEAPGAPRRQACNTPHHRARQASCAAAPVPTHTQQVRAAFFSEDRFGKRQLAPQAGEFGPS